MYNNQTTINNNSSKGYFNSISGSTQQMIGYLLWK
jgi:hypothetical protein